MERVRRLGILLSRLPCGISRSRDSFGCCEVTPGWTPCSNFVEGSPFGCPGAFDQPWNHEQLWSSVYRKYKYYDHTFIADEIFQLPSGVTQKQATSRGFSSRPTTLQSSFATHKRTSYDSSATVGSAIMAATMNRFLPIEKVGSC